MSTCRIPDCDRQSISRQLCTLHYQRLRNSGDPEKMRRRANGCGHLHSQGYVKIREAGGPQRRAHIVIAERALGHALPAGAEVHHVNEIKSDNRPENLVICPSRAYHKLLHLRIDALKACGNATWRKCKVCHQHDDPANLTSYGFFHLTCWAQYQRTRRFIKRDAQCQTI